MRSLWLDTDGALDWLRSYVADNKLSPVAPLGEDEEEGEGEEEGALDVNQLFIGLYRTVIDTYSK